MNTASGGGRGAGGGWMVVSAPGWPAPSTHPGAGGMSGRGCRPGIFFPFLVTLSLYESTLKSALFVLSPNRGPKRFCILPIIWGFWGLVLNFVPQSRQSAKLLSVVGIETSPTPPPHASVPPPPPPPLWFRWESPNFDEGTYTVVLIIYTVSTLCSGHILAYLRRC